MRQPNVLDDNLGMTISWLCIVQCLGEPILKAMMPAIAWNVSDQTHIILAGWVGLFAAAALGQDALRHCNFHIRCLMISGVFLVATAIIAMLMRLPEMVEILLTIAGNLVVVLAHNQNKKLICAHNALTCIADNHTMPDLSGTARSTTMIFADLTDSLQSHA